MLVRSSQGQPNPAHHPHPSPDVFCFVFYKLVAKILMVGGSSPSNLADWTLVCKSATLHSWLLGGDYILKYLLLIIGNTSLQLCSVLLTCVWLILLLQKGLFDPGAFLQLLEICCWKPLYEDHAWLVAKSSGLASYGLGGKMRGHSKGFGMEGIKRILMASYIQHQSLAPGANRSSWWAER